MKKLIVLSLFMLTMFTVMACNPSNIPTNPSLNGQDEITIEVGSVYTDPGVDYEDDERVTIAGTVDTTTLGEYTITYTIVVNDNTTVILERTVNVVDTTPPVITLTGGNVTLNQGENFIEPGFIASDNYDGDITEDVVVSNISTTESGEFVITYNVSDSSGNNATQQTRTLIVNPISANTAPRISLNGEANLTLSVGDTFTDPGATATDDEDGDLTSSIVKSGTVDTTTPGTYTITYNVTDSEGLAATTVTRTVIVEALPVNTAPSITLIGDATMTISVGDSFNDPGATASDTEDGDLTSSIVKSGTVDTTTAGTYTITYNVSDTDGLAATTVTRTVIVEALPVNSAPTITLLGDSTVTLTVGDTFTDPGATASDTEDGDLTSSIVKSGTVDTTTAGTYTITYNVTDTEGLAATSVTRTVIVEAVVIPNSAPSITLIGDTEIIIPLNGTYSESGATASDVEDGDLTNQIVITGSVNTSTAGSYIISYDVTDSEGLNATTITRTIHVVEEAINTVHTLYIAQGVDVVETELFSTLGYTNSVTLDTSTLGTYTITVDSDVLTIIIFDPLDYDLDILSGSVIIVPNSEQYNYFTFDLLIPSYNHVEFSTLFNGLSEMSLYHYGYLAHPLELLSSEPSASQSVYLSNGKYLLNIGNNSPMNSYQTVIIKTIETNSDIKAMMLDELITSYNRGTLDSYSFNNTVAGHYEITYYSYRPFSVHIKDALDQSIIHQAASFDGNYYTFRTHQHFAIGDYTIELTPHDQKGVIYGTLTDQVSDNYGYTNSIVMPLNTDETLIITPLKSWVKIHVTSAGYYQFDILYATSPIYDFYVYDDELDELSYTERMVYLESGTYYLDFINFTGELTLNISKTSGTITTNNTHGDAILIDPTLSYDVYFDGDFEEKWYKLEVLDAAVYDFFIHPNNLYLNGIIDLYDSALEPLLLNIYKSYQYLEPGTYYIKISIEDSNITKFSVELEDPLMITATMEAPYTLPLDETLSHFVMQDESYTYTFDTLDAILMFTYSGRSNADFELYDAIGNLIESGTAYSYDSYAIEFSAGTYTLIITPRHQSDIMSIHVKTYDPSLSAYSLDEATAGMIDFETPDKIYLIDEGTSVYVKLLLTESSVLYGYPINVTHVSIKDSSGNLVKEGNPWTTFPLALKAGEYLIELISDHPGFVEIHELYAYPIVDYGSMESTATMVPQLDGLRGFNPDGDTLDIIAFTLDEKRALSFSTYDPIEYQLFDAFFNPISEVGMMYQSFMTSLDAGSYYIVINASTSYYELHYRDISHLKVSHDENTPKTIYVGNTNQLFFENHFETAYMTFTLNQGAYIEFDLPNGYALELFDDEWVPYLDVYLNAGTYMIRLTRVEACYGDCDYELIPFTINNISSRVIDNDAESAITLENNEQFNKTIVDPNHEAWFTFTLENPSITVFSFYGSGATFTLYDNTGLIGSLPNGYSYFEAGTYMIKVNGDLTDYTINRNSMPYTPVSDEVGFETEVTLDSNGYFSLYSGIKSGTDYDTYKVTITEETLYYIYLYQGHINLYDESYTLLNTYYSSTYRTLTPGVYYIRVTYPYVAFYNVSFTNRNEYLEGSAFETAREIDLGVWVYAYFQTTPSSYYYTFTIEEETTISPYKGGYSSDTLIIYDHTYTEVTNLTLQPGTYYAVYGISYSAGNRSFVLSIAKGTTVGVSVDNTIDTPLIITDLEFLINYTGTISGDLDYFQITLNERILYGIEEYNYNCINMDIYAPSDLLNPIYTLNSCWNNELFLDAGTYIIEVEANTITYALSFTNTPYKDYSSTESTPYAWRILENVESYLAGLESDYFNFTLTQDTLLKAESVGNITVDLYDQTGTLIQSDIAYENLMMLAGDYMLKVTNNFDEANYYKLVMLNESSLIQSQTAVDAKLYEVYPYPTNVKGYITAGETQYIKFNFDQDTLFNHNCYLTCTLLDETLTPVIDPTSAISGIHYLKIESLVNTTYNFSIRNLSSRKTQGEMSEGTLYQFYLSDTQEVFTYTFTPTQTFYGAFDFLSTSKYLYLTVTDSSLVETFSYDAHVSDLKTEGIFFRSGETYTITMHGTTGDLSFILRGLRYIDGSDTIGNATIIDELDTPIYESFLDYKDEDYYQFTLTEETTIYMTFGSSSMQLIDQDMVTVLRTDSMSITLSAGTYYLKFTGDARLYGFTVNTNS